MYLHLPVLTTLFYLADHIHDLQALLLIAGNYTNQERYQIQLEKTLVVTRNVPKELNEALKEVKPWELNSGRIDIQDEFVHLGIQQSGDIEPAISTRLSNGRKTT